MQTLEELRTHLKLAHGIEPEGNHYLARAQHEDDHTAYARGVGGFDWQHDVNDWYELIDQA